MKNARKIKDRSIANDCFDTPLHIVKKMISMAEIKTTDIVLDPCSGDKDIFYNNLPECTKYLCEIKKEINFFEFNKEVDIIIGNPPFSLWDKWIDHTISLNPKKICYLYGALNLTPNRLKKLESKGYFLTKLIFTRITGYFGHSYLCLFETKENIPSERAISARIPVTIEVI